MPKNVEVKNKTVGARTNVRPSRRSPNQTKFKTVVETLVLKFITKNDF
ncbi:Uncharacterised protein [Chlamydia trachomatis]|nr:Uncharacterised protein [Chlamydia trachomatis]